MIALLPGNGQHGIALVVILAIRRMITGSGHGIEGQTFLPLVIDAVISDFLIGQAGPVASRLERIDHIFPLIYRALHLLADVQYHWPPDPGLVKPQDTHLGCKHQTLLSHIRQSAEISIFSVADPDHHAWQQSLRLFCHAQYPLNFRTLGGRPERVQPFLWFDMNLDVPFLQSVRKTGGNFHLSGIFVQLGSLNQIGPKHPGLFVFKHKGFSCF